ncbi:cytochrome c biogenesis protein CcdA [Paraburkholderia sp. JPY419]
MHSTLETPLALLAGLLTIASPCVLPVMPILLGTSVEQPSRTRPLFIVAGFILTFASFALLLGAVSSTVHVAQQVLRNTGIALLALSGLLRIWPRPYDWLVAQLQGPLDRIGAAIAPGTQPGSGNAGGFVLGMSLGAVWTPCAGPVLASILVLVVKAQDLGWSALLLHAVCDRRSDSNARDHLWRTLRDASCTCRLASRRASATGIRRTGDADRTRHLFAVRRAAVRAARRPFPLTQRTLT